MTPHRPNNDVRLNTVAESPVLQREGYTQNDFEKSGNYVPTMEGERVYAGLRFHKLFVLAFKLLQMLCALRSPKLSASHRMLSCVVWMATER